MSLTSEDSPEAVSISFPATKGNTNKVRSWKKEKCHPQEKFNL